MVDLARAAPLHSHSHFSPARRRNLSATGVSLYVKDTREIVLSLQQEGGISAFDTQGGGVFYLYYFL